MMRADTEVTRAKQNATCAALLRCERSLNQAQQSWAQHFKHTVHMPLRPCHSDPWDTCNITFSPKRLTFAVHKQDALCTFIEVWQNPTLYEAKNLSIAYFLTQELQQLNSQARRQDGIHALPMASKLLPHAHWSKLLMSILVQGILAGKATVGEPALKKLTPSLLPGIVIPRHACKSFVFRSYLEYHWTPATK